jgi:hypothetical protein
MALAAISRLNICLATTALACVSLGVVKIIIILFVSI